MDDSDRDYVDAPAESVTAVCRSCDGDGWRYVARAAVIGSRMVEGVKPEPCPECRPDEGGVPSGRVNLGAGPGARLRRVDRVSVPGVDDWGPRPG